MFLTRRKIIQVTLAILIFVGFGGFALLAATFYIQQQPDHQQLYTWRWFWTVWGVSAVVGGFFFLPQWLRNKTVIRDPAVEVPKFWNRYALITGLLVPAMLIGGVTYPEDLAVYIAAEAIAGGVIAALVIHSTAMLVTKRGRAMIERAAAERGISTQDPDN